MRRALAIAAITLFTFSASAAPQRDDDTLVNRIFKAVQKIVRRLNPLDEIMPPKP